MQAFFVHYESTRFETLLVVVVACNVVFVEIRVAFQSEDHDQGG